MLSCAELFNRCCYMMNVLNLIQNFPPPRRRTFTKLRVKPIEVVFKPGKNNRLQKYTNNRRFSNLRITNLIIQIIREQNLSQAGIFQPGIVRLRNPLLTFNHFFRSPLLHNVCT